MFELFVAKKHLVSRRRQTLLVVGAVALAVAITILFRSLINGFETTLNEIIFQFVPHVTVLPEGSESYIHLYKTLIETIWEIPGVMAVSPALSTTASFAHDDHVENVVLRGVVPYELNMISKIGIDYMVAGDLDSIQNGRRVALDQGLADELEVNLGDTVQVSFPDARTMSLVVSGIFDTGGFSTNYAYVSMETARDFLGEGNVVTDVQIKLEDIYQADEVASELEARGYNAESWQSQSGIVETIESRRFTNTLIMLLVIVIASFGIANIMNLLVLEKTREIGMMMAMGAAPKSVRKIFLIESGILGLAGGLGGCLIGYLIASYVNSLAIAISSGPSFSVILTFIVDPWDILAFPLITLLLSVVAGVYPAHQASKLDPVIALRG
ncbi:MAG: ABC transporter permease [Methanothrix sp.]|nr:ABC transporter permease [Methanothrix harundinacea]MDD2639187.1 ABC transporter permease [Methanothrix sp.]MDD3708769.1 ABC transporter permease [Methanothrix sp.]MDI9399758.1 ABC transporter permease [Euryarchaeota archaeon]